MGMSYVGQGKVNIFFYMLESLGMEAIRKVVKTPFQRSSKHESELLFKLHRRVHCTGLENGDGTQCS